MNRVLHIAKDLSLPLDAVTQTFAQIGKKGSGKTYLATMIAEAMLDAEVQVVAIDPVGNWFGLRIASDGHSKGKDIFVLGGEHGDVPLTPESGARVARLIVEKRISAVLDVSAFRIGERKRFAAAFGEELFHLKKTQRTPMHLFVEEAQLFIPQRVGPDEARMVGAFESIVRLGRNYGIGASLITQRPQSVNKEVLSQVECLCVLQVNGTHERKALEEWVQEAGADRKLIGELPGLERGEGYVWSPSWLRIFERVHFSKKTTFDASATPEVGKAAPAARLSAVDVEALRADLAEVVAAAEQDDPKALRRRIAELEAEARKKPSAAPAKVEQVKVPMLTGAEIRRIEKSAWKIEDTATKLETLAGKLREERKEILAKVNQPPPPPMRSSPVTSHPPIQNFAPRPAAFVNRQAADQMVSGKGERRMLEVLARVHPSPLTRDQLGVLAGYKASGGTFTTYFPRLKKAGLVEEDRDRLTLTADGQRGVPTLLLGSIRSPADLRELWRTAPNMGLGEWKIMEVLLAAAGAPISRQELGERSGYDHEGGTFTTYLPRLKKIRLAIEGRDGVRVAPELLG